MARFSFRLQRILDLRRQAAREADRALGRARVALAGVDERIAALEAGRAEAVGDLHRLGDGGAISAALASIRGLEAALVATRAGRLEAEKVVDLAILESRRRRRDVEVLEKLRVREKEGFALEERRRDDRLMDEIAAGRHRRADRAPGSVPGAGRTGS